MPMHNFIDLAGQTFNRWTVLARTAGQSKPTMYLCRCTCGTEKNVNAGSLRRGLSKSCGCWRQEYGIIAGKSTATHGCTRSPTHNSWTAMRARCRGRNNKAHRDWVGYAARGIKVCDRWMKFENFLADMGERPSNKHSIDRIDVDGNYEPGNCRWATSSQQRNNKRNSDWLTVGAETLTLAEWANKIGIGRSTLRKRVDMGWPPSRVVGAPVNTAKRSRGRLFEKV